MKTLIATLLAGAASASFAAAPTAALNHDPATYRNVTAKAAADYKAATARCNGMSGNDKDVCVAEAKAARARAESDAVAKYNNTEQGRAKARAKLAEADYDVAKAKCGAMSGADKDTCMSNAKSVHTAALADAKSGRDTATGSSGTGEMVAGSGNPAAARAIDKCEKAGGGDRTGCVIDNKGQATTLANKADSATERAADRTRDAAATVGEKTRAAAATAAEKTKEVARTAVDKTKQVAATAADKTENAMERAGEKTREVASTTAQKTDNAMERAGDRTRDNAAAVADKADGATDKAAANTRDAGARTAVAASDTAITTKVKAGLLKEPDLKSLGIHVETEKGVVMLSGFVESKAEADKAVKVAKGVDGVTSVKSAIKVK